MVELDVPVHMVVAWRVAEVAFPDLTEEGDVRDREVEEGFVSDHFIIHPLSCINIYDYITSGRKKQ